MRRGQKTRQHEDKHQEQSSAQCPVPPPTSPPTSYQKQAPRSMWDDAGALVVGKVAAGSVVAPHHSTDPDPDFGRIGPGGGMPPREAHQ